MVTQNDEPSTFHQPAGIVPVGQVFSPVMVQQNSVYPSQHVWLQLQLWLLQLQMAAYAVPGRSTYAAGAAATALPTTAERVRNPRRDVWVAIIEPALSTKRTLTGLPSKRFR